MDEGYEHQLIHWAHTYDGYQRLAGTPEQLWEVLAPLREAFETECAIPEWAGVDLLRGWVFYLVRAHRHGGGWQPLWEDYPEITAILDAISRHPATGKSERPPTPTRR